MWGIATAALLIASAAGYAASRSIVKGGDRFQVLSVIARLVAAPALLLGLILHVISSDLPPLSSLEQRAALVALVAVVLLIGPGLRDLRSKPPQTAWAGLIPAAVVAGIGTVSHTLWASSAWWLLAFTPLAAGIGLWAAGQGLEVITQQKRDNRGAASLTFAGFTLNVALLAGTSWRVWGTPGGTSAMTSDFSSGFLSLVAVALVSAARLVLKDKPPWLTGMLDVLVAGLAIWVALVVRWNLPPS